MRTARIDDRSIPLELSQLNLAFYPGAHLMTVLACMPLADTAYRVESTTELQRELCQVIVDDVCNPEAELREVIWSSLDDMWGMRAPKRDNTFWATLQPRLSPDGLAMIGYSHEARREEVACAQ